MPVVVSQSVSNSGSGSGCSRKEKKKQAKEERDRLKQAEKKKRRLEKALANAAAIRSELEKKKQRRKEEEQRLDEEGAALAEAVALQVLVDEESDGFGFHIPNRTEKSDTEEKQSLGSNESVVGDSTGIVSCCGPYRKGIGFLNGAKRPGNFRHSGFGEHSRRLFNDREVEWGCEGESSRQPMITSQEDEESVDGEDLCSGSGLISNAEKKARASNERARAAEVAAGLAAAQAVAALRIAEEARAEAEAAKKAAEAAMNQALDRRDAQRLLDEAKTQESIGEDKDELKARLKETERKLMEKTRRVSELEHNLEEVTQYLLEFKAIFESCKTDNHLIEPSNSSVDH